jgi:hypothetical protein
VDDQEAPGGAGSGAPMKMRTFGLLMIAVAFIGSFLGFGESATGLFILGAGAIILSYV